LSLFVDCESDNGKLRVTSYAGRVDPVAVEIDKCVMIRKQNESNGRRIISEIYLNWSEALEMYRMMRNVLQEDLVDTFVAGSKE